MVVKKRAGLGKGLDALLGKKEVVITLSEAGGDASSELDIEKIQPGQYQPRTQMDKASLEELAQSIREQGLISPILAFFCWYAKGDGWFAILISAGILAFMINSTLSYGMWYINIRSFLHLIMLFLGIIILHKSIKETVYIIALAIPITVLLDILIPFHY